MAMAMAMAISSSPFTLSHHTPLSSPSASSTASQCCLPIIPRHSPPPHRFTASSPLRSNRLSAERSRIAAKTEEGSEEGSMGRESLIDRSEATLGKLFGGRVWFSVLLISLSLFAGGYVYLIVNFADFSDIPIFAVR